MNNIIGTEMIVVTVFGKPRLEIDEPRFYDRVVSVPIYRSPPSESERQRERFGDVDGFMSRVKP